MSIIRITSTLVGVVLVASVPAWAKTETVQGQLVDQSCYMKDMANNKGVDHKMPADTKDCAIACAKKGQPMALLTADGKVYAIYGGLAANNNAKLMAHIGHSVEVTGDTMDMSGSLLNTAGDLKMGSKRDTTGLFTRPSPLARSLGSRCKVEGERTRDEHHGCR